MTEKEKYNYIYECMNKGCYSGVVRNSKTFELETQIITSKVKKACIELNVDFNSFMKYARDKIKGC